MMLDPDQANERRGCGGGNGGPDPRNVVLRSVVQLLLDPDARFA